MVTIDGAILWHAIGFGKEYFGKVDRVTALVIWGNRYFTKIFLKQSPGSG